MVCIRERRLSSYELKFVHSLMITSKIKGPIKNKGVSVIGDSLYSLFFTIETSSTSVEPSFI